MQGYFDVQVKDLCGLHDEDLLRLMTPQGKATPELSRLLDRLPTRQHAFGKNLVNDNFAGYSFLGFGGGDIADPYDFGGLNVAAALATICLTTNDAEPTYQESSYTSYVTMHNVPNSVNTGNAGKRFIEDQIETHLIQVDSGGRESILFRSRWMYLAAEAASSNIRSLDVLFSEDADTTSTARRGIIARIRFKNSGGSPIVITKSTAQVLLIEYRFTLVTV